MAQAGFGAQAPMMGVSASARADVEVLGRRVVATLVDAGVLGILAVAVFVVQWVVSLLFLGASAGLGLSEGAQLAVGLVLSLLNIAVYLALFFGYYVYFEGRRGQTVGKMVVSIRVVREDTGGVPGTKAALVRTLLRLVDGFMAYLVGYLVASSSEKRQRLGDKVARTLVVADTGAGWDVRVRSRSRLRQHGGADFFEYEEDFGVDDETVGDFGGADFGDSGGGDSGGSDS